MEAKKNIFGQYVAYESPILSEQEIVVVTAIVNAIADQIQLQLSDEEFVKETSVQSATLQWLVGQVNNNLPETIERVDGKSLLPIMKKVITARVEAITNNGI